jgi:hypothetical protein
MTSGCVLDRILVFAALAMVLLFMVGLVAFKGCTASDPIIMQLGTIATGLSGALCGLARNAPEGSQGQKQP